MSLKKKPEIEPEQTPFYPMPEPEPEPIKPKDAIIPEVGSPIDIKQEKRLAKKGMAIKSNFKMTGNEDDINFYKRNV